VITLMAERRYTDVRIVDEIYVSSSADYFATVVFKDKGKHQSREYWLAGTFLGRGEHMEWNGAPRYFEAEVRHKIGELLKGDKVRFYEYNQDRVKRYENLRYHAPELLQHYIERFSK
jgi:hypothetical protein